MFGVVVCCGIGIGQLVEANSARRMRPLPFRLVKV